MADTSFLAGFAGRTGTMDSPRRQEAIERFKMMPDKLRFTVEDALYDVGRDEMVDDLREAIGDPHEGRRSPWPNLHQKFNEMLIQRRTVFPNNLDAYLRLPPVYRSEVFAINDSAYMRGFDRLACRWRHREIEREIAEEEEALRRKYGRRGEYPWIVTLRTDEPWYVDALAYRSYDRDKA